MRRYPPTGLLLLVVLAASALVVLGQLPGNTLLWRALQNAGHIPLFMLITLSVLLLVKQTGRRREWQAIVMTAVVVMLLAVATEWLQTFSGRQVSVTDLLHDALAMLATILLYIRMRFESNRARISAVWRYGLIAAATALLLYALLPLLTLGWHTMQRNQAMPVVMDLSAPWQVSFLDLQKVRIAPAKQEGFTRVELLPGEYPGVENIEPVADWSAYHRLTFRILSEQADSFSLVLRIHDAAHNQDYSDRYNRRLTVLPGMNQYHINLQAVRQAPAGRSMQIDSIASIVLFAVKRETPVVFAISPLRLQ